MVISAASSSAADCLLSETYHDKILLLDYPQWGVYTIAVVEIANMSNSNNIVDLQDARSRRQGHAEFQWVDRFILTRPDDLSFIDFTQEGRLYYRRWFTRYGYPIALMDSFETFVQTVRAILKSRIAEAPEIGNPEDPVMKEIDAILQAGDFERLVELAGRIRQQHSAQVIQL